MPCPPSSSLASQLPLEEMRNDTESEAHGSNHVLFFHLLLSNMYNSPNPIGQWISRLTMLPRRRVSVCVCRVWGAYKRRREVSFAMPPGCSGPSPVLISPQPEMEATAASFHHRAVQISILTAPLRRHLLLVLSCLLCCCLASSSSSHIAVNPLRRLAERNSTDDGQTLLAFKSMLTDGPLGVLGSWRNGSHCSWRGVTCGGWRHPERVTELDLHSLGLAGAIPAVLANLTFLRRIHLGDNRFHGSLPSELGRLSRLQHLNVSLNSLSGGIPADLAELGQNLVTLDLSWNTLTGGIPPWLGNFSSLTQLLLYNNALGGTIPASLSQLSSLRILRLSMNGLNGGIPPALGSLSALTLLSLSNNSLSGAIPSSLSNLTSLRLLSLRRNNLEGAIPPALGYLPFLTVFDASTNNLSGTIPPSLGNLSSSCQVLSLTSNNLVGPIPTTVGNLASLAFFTVALNRLQGTIPASLYNLSSLATLDLRGNQFTGTLPMDIGSTLPNLENFSVGDNLLHGYLPSSLSNATGLRNVLLDNNSFTGVVPPNLGNLRRLQRLMLYANRFEAEDANDWSFLTSLTNCSQLEALGLHRNNFGGILPSSLANLSIDLDKLSIENNHISGSIPAAIGNLVNLTVLSMAGNLFVGSIPTSVGKLQKLVYLDLSRNRLSGPIPPSISNLTQMSVLYLNDNELQGAIPPSIGNMQNLQELVLSYNKLSGLIPKEIVSIQFLSKVLNLSHNSLSGPLPPEMGRLENINTIDVSDNKLSGGIPATLGRCQVLETLYMQGNALNGSIPQVFSDLKGIRRMDLSRNSLSGDIPKFLANLQSLEYLNLSFNNLQGEVPKGGVFRNSSAVLLVGNRNLCGGDARLFHLPACTPQEPTNGRHRSTLLKVIISVSSVVFCLLLLSFLYLVFTGHRRRKTPAPTAPSMDLVGRLTYSDLFKATDGFSSRNLIGAGSFGSVYKAELDPNDPNKKLVAVKVINLQQRGASKSFLAECEALRSIRHRNLLKILTSCSSVDNSGNSFKALVFEYMPNGSLEKWLHPGKHSGGADELMTSLSLRQRLDIAIDVASALSYLHHHAHRPIIHCDLKPSNVLLDNEMTAHVGDFGIARFLAKDASRSTTNLSSSSVVRGTIGYAAPEYGMGSKVSTEGDVYSYGIFLLEMITRRRPTDIAFKEELTLRKFVERSFPEQVLDIVDEGLLSEEGESDQERGLGETTVECLVSMTRIALQCSNDSPRERMKMEDVMKEMTATRDVLPRRGGVRGKETGRSSTHINK